MVTAEIQSCRNEYPIVGSENGLATASNTTTPILENETYQDNLESLQNTVNEASWTNYSVQYPVVDFSVWNGKLCAATNNSLHLYDGTSWTAFDAPTAVNSLKSYENKLFVGGEGGLYSFNGTTFSLVFTVPSYIKVMGVYNNTLYSESLLDNAQILYYCSGSAGDPTNWHVDTGFADALNPPTPFGRMGSFAVYNNRLYLTYDGTILSYDGSNWTIVKIYDDVYSFSSSVVFNGKLYFATRDQSWRKPYYQGFSGFSGRVIEFDGDNWTTLLDHEYWMFSLETVGGLLYAGTANQILTFDGSAWNVSFNVTEGAYCVLCLAAFNDRIYAGMGNGYVFSRAETTKLDLTIVGSGLTSPSGGYRWLDVADQAYGSNYRNSYNYSQASATVTYYLVGKTLTGTLAAQNLKPNFAYQLKLVGTPGTSENELIGMAGRWWQEVWNGTAWTGGQNLNDKGNGSSPNPNDLTYLSRRFLLDGSSPTGYHYRYTGYLLFGYFITDSNGNVTLSFHTGSCYHVLWKTSQRGRTSSDGPLVTATFDPDPSQPAYDIDYPNSTTSIFGEWERLPMDGVNLASGQYDCQIVLTEESFHGTAPLAGNWAAAMNGEINFTITG